MIKRASLVVHADHSERVAIFRLEIHHQRRALKMCRRLRAFLRHRPVAFELRREFRRLRSEHVINALGRPNRHLLNRHAREHGLLHTSVVANIFARDKLVPHVTEVRIAKPFKRSLRFHFFHAQDIRVEFVNRLRERFQPHRFRHFIDVVVLTALHWIVHRIKKILDVVRSDAKRTSVLLGRALDAVPNPRSANLSRLRGVVRWLC